MNTVNNFGRTLRQLRKDNDLTQEGLGNELGVKGDRCFNKSTISRWENGSRKPDIETVKDLEEILGANRGELLRAAGYFIETGSDQLVSSQIDLGLIKQKGEHFTELVSIAKSLLVNGLENVSCPRWTTNRSKQVKYVIPNQNTASVYDEITKEQLSRHLNSNLAAILKDRDWFFRYCFVPHLKSELPNGLKAKLLDAIIEEQPYHLIDILRRLAAGETFKGTCDVCKYWQ